MQHLVNKLRGAFLWRANSNPTLTRTFELIITEWRTSHCVMRASLSSRPQFEATGFPFFSPLLVIPFLFSFVTHLQSIEVSDFLAWT